MKFEVEGLSVNYGGIEAVRDISFSVEEGEIVTLIGKFSQNSVSLLE